MILRELRDLLSGLRVKPDIATNQRDFNAEFAEADAEIAEKELTVKVNRSSQRVISKFSGDKFNRIKLNIRDHKHRIIGLEVPYCGTIFMMKRKHQRTLELVFRSSNECQHPVA